MQKIIFSAVILLLSVAVNAQVVKCNYKSTYHETDSYTCEDRYERSYTRKNLLKEPSPHRVMYSCRAYGSIYPWAFKELFVKNPVSKCNSHFASIKKELIETEKRLVRYNVMHIFETYIKAVLEYYGKTGVLTSSMEDVGISSTYITEELLYSWKDKKQVKVSMHQFPPTGDNGITIILDTDLPNTGCKKGTSITFLIDKDYRILFPNNLKKHACFDSLAINGSYNRDFFIPWFLNGDGVSDDHSLFRARNVKIKNGDTFLADAKYLIENARKKIKTGACDDDDYCSRGDVDFGDSEEERIKIMSKIKSEERAEYVKESKKKENIKDEDDLNSLIDPRDGKRYRVVKIGSQIWMAENLNYEMTGSWCYNDDSWNCKKYGRLYSWESAKNACPTDWHLATGKEYKRLFDGVEECDGNALKSVSGWKDVEGKNGNGTDDFGFCALPAGRRDPKDPDVLFRESGRNAYFWSTSGKYNRDAYCVELNNRYCYAKLNRCNEEGGYSIRCVKDN